jgi:hypothetical protein
MFRKFEKGNQNKIRFGVYSLITKNMPDIVKNIIALIFIAGLVLIASCKKDSESEPYKLLTGPVWASDSLIVNGADASGPDGMLKNFKGDAKFNKDYTGYFGKYNGTWRFAYNEAYIVISSDSLSADLTTKIAELTKISLKITTSYPNLLNPAAPFNIRMTFKAK